MQIKRSETTLAQAGLKMCLFSKTVVAYRAPVAERTESACLRREGCRTPRLTQARDLRMDHASARPGWKEGEGDLTRAEEAKATARAKTFLVVCHALWPGFWSPHDLES